MPGFNVTPIQSSARTGMLVGRSHTTRPVVTVDSDPVAVDLGSAQLRIWFGPAGVLNVPIDEGRRTPIMRRGRIVDAPGCLTELRRLLREHRVQAPVGGLVVACRPVLASAADQEATRQVLTAALAPSRLLLFDTVRAGAIGAGAAAGTLLLADVGAQLIEVAVLADGRILGARRAEVGTRDLNHAMTEAMLADTVARLVRELRGQPAVRPRIAAALTRGVVVVGDGATRPELTARLVTTLGVAVHCAASPRTAALSGASLAAVAALRHPAGN